MLVAVAASQNLDMFKFGQGKSLLMNKQYGQNELLMKKLGYPMLDMNMYGQKDLLNKDLPYYLQGDLVDSKILTIDELFTTQLFKEYMSLPLFREYIQYPVFQKFIQSVYFQKFWTIPTFKQYFVQPELFYKFVLPIVQLFKYDTTTMSTLEQQQIVNKNVFPFVADYETEFTVPSTYYNKDLTLQDGLFYKNILDKIYSHLYNIDETTTVKKIVDPITGEIKMIPFGGIDTIFGDKLVKDVLLKKFLINKNIDIEHIFGDKLIADLLVKKNVDTDLLKKIILAKGLDIDTTIFGDKLSKDMLLKKNVDVELLKTLLFKKNVDVELVKKLLLNKMILGDDMMTTFYPQELKEKMMMTKFNPLVARMMYGYNKKFDNLDVMGKLNLFDILSKKDLINNKFQNIDVVDKMNLFDILSKKHLALTDKVILNKILADKINVSLNMIEIYRESL